MTKKELQKLVEVTDLKDISKLGLEPYTAPIIKQVYLGGRLPISEDKERALKETRGRAEGATHFMAASANSAVTKDYMIYSFVFYGPPKRT